MPGQRGTYYVKITSIRASCLGPRTGRGRGNISDVEVENSYYHLTYNRLSTTARIGFVVRGEERGRVG